MSAKQRPSEDLANARPVPIISPARRLRAAVARDQLEAVERNRARLTQLAPWIQSSLGIRPYQLYAALLDRQTFWLNQSRGRA